MSFFGWLTGSPNNTDNASTKPEAESTQNDSMVTDFDLPPTERKRSQSESTHMYEKRSTIDIVNDVALWVFVLGNAGLSIYLVYTLSEVNKDLTDDLEDLKNIKDHLKDVKTNLQDANKKLDDVNNDLKEFNNKKDRIEKLLEKEVDLLLHLKNNSHRIVELDQLNKHLAETGLILTTLIETTNDQTKAVNQQQESISSLNTTIKDVEKRQNTPLFFSRGITKDTRVIGKTAILFDKVFDAENPIGDPVYLALINCIYCNGYYAKHRRFYSPVSGYYMIIVHVSTLPNISADVRILQKFQVATIHAGNHQGRNDTSAASNTVVKYLSKGAQLMVYTYNRSITYGINGDESPDSTFTCVLLYACEKP